MAWVLKTNIRTCALEQNPLTFFQNRWHTYCLLITNEKGLVAGYKPAFLKHLNSKGFLNV